MHYSIKGGSASRAEVLVLALLSDGGVSVSKNFSSIIFENSDI